MNQTEIFQAMTKGEWKPFIDGTSGTYSVRQKPVKPIDRLAQVTICEGIEQGKMEGQADAEAIVSAVNNTYGKGINPEAVERMRTALVAITLADLPPTKQWIIKEAKEALTAAKTF